MRSSRLETVRRIERKKHADSEAGTTAQTGHTTPVAHKQIQELRQLGLSVSTQASPEHCRVLRQEFEWVSRYVHDVWDTLAPDPTNPPGPSNPRLDRFAAALFGDGQLASRVVALQQAREPVAPNKPPRRNSTFNQVAKLLRHEFDDTLPKRPWWAMFRIRP